MVRLTLFLSLPIMPKTPINEGFERIHQRGSRIVAEGTHMLPAASLMMAAGVIDKISDRKKPFITVVNSYTTHIPGHAHLDKLGERLVKGLKQKGYNVWYCNVGGSVDDGIAMGHFGMKYSLASRELMTDQIETVIGAHPCDAFVCIGNCDKIVPSMLNAMVRLNVPSVYVSGGPMLSGKEKSDLVTVFEGVGAHSAGEITEQRLEQIASQSCRTCGSVFGDVYRQLDELPGRSHWASLAGQWLDPSGRLDGSRRSNLSVLLESCSVTTFSACVTGLMRRQKTTKRVMI